MLSHRSYPSMSKPDKNSKAASIARLNCLVKPHLQVGSGNAMDEEVEIPLSMHEETVGRGKRERSIKRHKPSDKKKKRMPFRRSKDMQRVSSLKQKSSKTKEVPAPSASSRLVTARSMRKKQSRQTPDRSKPSRLAPHPASPKKSANDSPSKASLATSSPRSANKVQEFQPIVEEKRSQQGSPTRKYKNKGTHAGSSALSPATVDDEEGSIMTIASVVTAAGESIVGMIKDPLANNIPEHPRRQVRSDLKPQDSAPASAPKNGITPQDAPDSVNKQKEKIVKEKQDKSSPMDEVELGFDVPLPLTQINRSLDDSFSKLADSRHERLSPPRSPPSSPSSKKALQSPKRTSSNKMDETIEDLKKPLSNTLGCTNVFVDSEGAHVTLGGDVNASTSGTNQGKAQTPPETPPVLESHSRTKIVGFVEIPENESLMDSDIESFTSGGISASSSVVSNTPSEFSSTMRFGWWNCAVQDVLRNGLCAEDFDVFCREQSVLEETTDQSSIPSTAVSV